jgi:hypothetical protein
MLWFNLWTGCEADKGSYNRRKRRSTKIKSHACVTNSGNSYLCEEAKVFIIGHTYKRKKEIDISLKSFDETIINVSMSLNWLNIPLLINTKCWAFVQTEPNSRGLLLHSFQAISLSPSCYAPQCISRTNSKFTMCDIQLQFLVWQCQSSVVE